MSVAVFKQSLYSWLLPLKMKTAKEKRRMGRKKMKRKRKEWG